MAPAESPGWRRLFRGQFRKTKMCHFHALGRCHYGEKCAFAHSPEDLECAPDLTKTAMCIAWQKGNCPLKAADCHFAHGTHELRLTPVFNKAKLSQRTRLPQDQDEMSDFAHGSTREGSTHGGSGSIAVSRESTEPITHDFPAPWSVPVATNRLTASSLSDEPWCNNLPISAPPGLELPMVYRRTWNPAALARPASFRVESAAFAASAAAAAVTAAASAANAADAAAVAATTASFGPHGVCLSSAAAGMALRKVWPYHAYAEGDQHYTTPGDAGRTSNGSSSLTRVGRRPRRSRDEWVGRRPRRSRDEWQPLLPLLLFC